MDYPYLDTVIYDNFYEMLKGRYETKAKTTAIRFMDREQITDISYEDMIKETSLIGLYLKTQGIEGKHIGIFSENRYEYITIYMATVMKNVIVPLDKEITSKNLSECVKNFDVDYLLVTDETKQKTESAEFSKPDNLKILNIDDEDFKKVFKDKSADKEKCIEEFFEYVKDTDKDRFAVLASTSGTDGAMKGVMLSQYNVITNIRGTLENNVLKNPTFAFLPMNHTYGFNPCILATIYNGTTLCLNLKTKYLLRDLRTFNPFFFGAVPMVIEGMYDSIIREVKKQNKENTFNRAIKICKFFRKFGIDLRHIFFGKLICKNLRLVVNGGAALNADYVNKFDEIGITILNGYGLTECSPTIAVSRTGNNVVGSAGTIMKNIDVKIAEDGEILVKGPCVMLGYYKNEEATKAIMRDGYLATGDIGYTDGKVIFVTGRKKNLIILENGKNVPPELLESKINSIPYVKESIVVSKKVNDRSNILYAIIVLHDEEKQEFLKDDIANINKDLPSYMQITDFEVSKDELKKNSSKKIIRSVYANKNE
ncbi:MAG: AMP-binding protein [Lachnospiraceae bacterium]|nr:AMP-binding protein [Lachnospiraceae bacterium]